jgi:hypothetical protein
MKLDVNTKMLLSETLGAVVALARPKLSKETVAAIKARPHDLQLTDRDADPCLDLSELRKTNQAFLTAAKAAADLVKEASKEGPEAQAAAEAAAAEAQQKVQDEVLVPRMRRRQLCTKVRCGAQLQADRELSVAACTVLGMHTSLAAERRRARIDRAGNGILEGVGHWRSCDDDLAQFIFCWMCTHWFVRQMPERCDASCPAVLLPYCYCAAVLLWPGGGLAAGHAEEHTWGGSAKVWRGCACLDLLCHLTQQPSHALGTAGDPLPQHDHTHTSL